LKHATRKGFSQALLGRSSELHNVHHQPHATKRIPEEVFYGKKVDLSRFRVFGSKVMAFTPKAKRSSKWVQVSEEMLFMGFTKGVKGYRCINPKNSISFIHRSVKFIEEQEIIDDDDDFLFKKPEAKETSSEDPKIEITDSDTEDPDDVIVEPQPDVPKIPQKGSPRFPSIPSGVQTRSQARDNVLPSSDWRANFAENEWKENLALIWH
jgi:hypothetical protein